MEAVRQPSATSTPRNAEERRSCKEEKIGALLGLQLRDRILRTIPCFLLAEILVQGTMVLTDHHVCFYSNIPGLKRSVKMKFVDIEDITKEKVYGIFPTGIGICTGKDKRTFSFVTSREKLLLALRSHWESRLAEKRASEQAAATSAEVAVSEMTDSSASERDSGVAASMTDSSVSVFDEELPQLDSATSWLTSLCATGDRAMRALMSRNGLLTIAVLLAALTVALLAARVTSLQRKVEMVTGDQGTAGDRPHWFGREMAADLQLALDNIGELHKRLRLLRQSLSEIGGSDTGS